MYRTVIGPDLEITDELKSPDQINNQLAEQAKNSGHPRITTQVRKS